MQFRRMQALCGHGCFNEYLKGRSRAEIEDCKYCRLLDDTKHNLFDFARWLQERAECAIRFGEIREGNLVQLMLESKENWSIVQTMITSIMKKKFLEDET